MLATLIAIIEFFNEIRAIRDEDTDPNKGSLWGLIYNGSAIYLEYIRNLNAGAFPVIEEDPESV